MSKCYKYVRTNIQKRYSKVNQNQVPLNWLIHYCVFTGLDLSSTETTNDSNSEQDLWRVAGQRSQWTQCHHHPTNPEDFNSVSWTVDFLVSWLTGPCTAEDVSTTRGPVSQRLQPNAIKHNAGIALGRPNSTQGWNCLFIISIMLGLWKMALTICGKIEEVIFLSKCVLMMCCLMECLSPAFQNAGNRALFSCFISMRDGSDGWGILL